MDFTFSVLIGLTLLEYTYKHLALTNSTTVAVLVKSFISSNHIIKKKDNYLAGVKGASLSRVALLPYVLYPISVVPHESTPNVEKAGPLAEPLLHHLELFTKEQVYIGKLSSLMPLEKTTRNLNICDLNTREPPNTAVLSHPDNKSLEIFCNAMQVLVVAREGR